MAHFPQDRILELGRAAIDANLPRDVLLLGMMPAYVGTLRMMPQPNAQLRTDLAKMNEDGPRIDGSLPIVVWLKNAVANTDPAEPAHEVLRSALDELLARLAGLPPRVAPASLPELKEVIVHQDDMVDFDFLQAGARVGASVAKLMVPRFSQGQPERGGGQQSQFTGTGWLIAQDLLITNHHVMVARGHGEHLPDPQSLQLQVLGTEALFGYDSYNAPVSSVRVVGLLASDPELDYAILQLERAPGPPALKRCPTDLWIDGTNKVPVNIIQHPRGKPKKVAMRNNMTTRSEGNELRYFTDTDFGSSGSPVFNEQWEVVALHRGAIQLVQGVQFQGKDTACVNVGTRIVPLLQHVERHFQAVWRKL